MNLVKRFLKDEQGLETMEYAIILGLIVVATISLIGGLGTWISQQFQAVSDTVGAGTAP